jgi:hypothetical protein
MSDETYSIFMILGAIASGAVLWLHFLRGRAMRRLLKSLRETNPELFQDDGELKKPE